MAGKRNDRIKRANQETTYTPQQVMELKRCAEDPVYFAKKYVMIQHPKLGAIPFELYDYQIWMMRAFQENRYNIILSARQTGKCCSGTSMVSVITPHTIPMHKKILLWALDRKLYRELFE